MSEEPTPLAPENWLNLDWGVLSEDWGSSPKRSAEEIAFAPWYLLLSNEAEVGAIFDFVELEELLSRDIIPREEELFSSAKLEALF